MLGLQGKGSGSGSGGEAGAFLELPPAGVASLRASFRKYAKSGDRIGVSGLQQVPSNYPMSNCGVLLLLLLLLISG